MTDVPRHKCALGQCDKLEFLNEAVAKAGGHSNCRVAEVDAEGRVAWVKEALSSHSQKGCEVALI